MRSIRVGIMCCLASIVGALLLASSPCICANATSAPVPEVRNMEPGESMLLSGVDITRASVNSPEVVDLVTVSTAEVILNAKSEGKATVRIWDKTRDPATYEIYVAKKRPDPLQTAAQLTKDIAVDTISVKASGQNLILSGAAKSEDEIKRAVFIAESSGLKVLNLVKVELIAPATIIASLTAVIKNDALKFETLADNTVYISGVVPTTMDAFKIRDIVAAWTDNGTGQASGAGVTSNTQVSFGDQQSITPPDAVDRAKVEARQKSPGEVVVGEEVTAGRCVFSGRVPNGPRVVAVLDVDLSAAKQVIVTAQVLEVNRDKMKQLGINWGSNAGGTFINQPFFVTENSDAGTVPFGGVANAFSRLPFAAQIRALVENDSATILSEPKLLIADGHAASMLVGGELPIPIAQNSSIGTASVTVAFKPFGIQLTVRPKIAPDNSISLTVTPEVSDIDPSRGISTGGITIPAITVRRATTTVHVQNGQSLAIGGLFSSNVSKVVKEIPLLSKIPVLGELFKSKSFQNQQTELVIIVTPRVLEKGVEIPMPKQDGK